VIVSGRRQNLVTATERVLTHDLRRNVGVARLGEIAIGGAANEAALALRIEPAGGLAVRHYWSERCALRLISAWSLLLLLLLSSAAALPTTAALPATPALIASTASVVTMVTIAVLILFTLALALSLSAAITTTTLIGLRIVLRLLL